MNAAEMVAKMREAAAEGLTELGEHVQIRTRERTPDDPATSGDDLPGSIEVEPATPGDLEAVVYTNSEYAIYQHENLTLAHPTGQSKYLETTALESARDAERIIGAAVARKFG